MNRRQQPGDYRVGYAKAGDFKCRLTKENIPKDALRITIIGNDKFFNAFFPNCYNFEDWIKDEELVKKFKESIYKKGKKIYGIENLNKEDQLRINILLFEKDLQLFLNKLHEYACQKVITLCDITMQINEETL
ncbi:hypothetical protein ABK040_015241 [Willaertia magna]